MKRALLTLIPWMVMVVAAVAQTRSADVLYTYHDSVPQRAFRVGDECFVPIESLKDWGWQVEVHGELADLTAESHRFTVPTRSIAGRQTVPIRMALDQIGASSQWLLGADTLEVLANLKSVEVSRSKLKFEASLAIKTHIFAMEEPNRLIVDIQGARISKDTYRRIGEGARLIQYKPDVARIIVETPFIPDTPKKELDETHEFDMSVDAAPVLNEDPAAPQQPATTPANTAPLPSPGVLSLTLQSDNPSQTDMYIDLRGQTHGQVTFRIPDPVTLEVRIPGVTLSLPQDFRLGSDAALATSRIDGQDTVLTLALSRPMGAQVDPDDSGARIVLIKPNVGNGKLAGKIIVVDPGHGGHDQGAHAGGVLEKSLNLAMAKVLAAKLSAEGATVIMTRSSDVFIPLDTRAQMANKANADLFISCHTNSSGGHGQSGATTYHHLGRATGMVLAQCIQREIAKVSGIANDGAKSDGVIYRTGFSVLRNTQMPGVLLEMGFVDSARDRRRIVTDEFRDAITSAVVKGIKEYLGDAKISG